MSAWDWYIFAVLCGLGLLVILFALVVVSIASLRELDREW